MTLPFDQTLGLSHPFSVGKNVHSWISDPRNKTPVPYVDLAERDADPNTNEPENIGKAVQVGTLGSAQVFTLLGVSPRFWSPDIFGSGTDEFLELIDVFESTYTGQGLKGVRVNAGETGLEFSVGQDGDVIGPATSTDNALARFDLATGKLIQDSLAILDDLGALSGLTQVQIDTLTILGSTLIDSTNQITLESPANDTLVMKGPGIAGAPVLFNILSGTSTSGKFGDLGTSGLDLTADFGQIGWKNFADLELAPRRDTPADIALYTPNAGLTSLVDRFRIKTGTGEIQIAGDVLIANLILTGNTLGTTDANGNLLLAPNGAGLVDVTTRRIINVVDPTADQDAATRKFVLDNAGDVFGPGSSTDNAMTIWDGVTGKLLKNSPHTIDPTTGKITFDTNEDVVARFVMNAASGNPSFIDVEDLAAVRTRFGYFGSAFLSNGVSFGQIGTSINGAVVIAARGNFASGGIQMYTPNAALDTLVLRMLIDDITGNVGIPFITAAAQLEVASEIRVSNAGNQSFFASMFNPAGSFAAALISSMGVGAIAFRNNGGIGTGTFATTATDLQINRFQHGGDFLLDGDLDITPDNSLYQEVYPNSDRQVLALSMQDQLDRSSFGNDLLLEGSAIIEENVGRIGKGLSLDGTNATTGRVLTNSSLEFTDDLSVDFWLFPADSGSTFCPVVAKMDSGTGKGWNVTYFSNSVRITFRDDTTLTDLILANGLVPTVTWTYIAVTFDKSTLTLKVYINGILTNTNVVSQGWTDSGDDLMIGTRLNNGNPTNFCNINVSNVRVYNRVLALEEIRIQYLR